MLSIDDFQKMELRTAKVLSCEEHPNADKLLVLKVDVGEEEPRQLVAGLKQWYQPDDLVGRDVVIVANLEPATLRGVQSNGMLLAAQDGDEVIVVSPEKPIKPGAVVR